MSTSNQNELPLLNAFEMLKKIHEKSTEADPMEDFAEDDTVKGAHIQKLPTTRISMMVTIDEVAKVKAKAASEAANEVLEAIVNQFPDVRVARWEAGKPTTNDPTLLYSLPEEVNDVEPYMYGFTRFFGKPKGYFRLNLCHSEETSAGAINRFCNSNLRIQGQQFVQVAHSSTKNPIVVGFFTGSTPEMASSGDVTTLFQQLFGLKEFGLYWNNIRTSHRRIRNGVRIALLCTLRWTKEIWRRTKQSQHCQLTLIIPFQTQKGISSVHPWSLFRSSRKVTWPVQQSRVALHRMPRNR
jgi:hypothetical protein